MAMDSWRLKKLIKYIALADIALVLIFAGLNIVILVVHNNELLEENVLKFMFESDTTQILLISVSFSLIILQFIVALALYLVSRKDETITSSCNCWLRLSNLFLIVQLVKTGVLIYLIAVDTNSGDSRKSWMLFFSITEIVFRIVSIYYVKKGRDGLVRVSGCAPPRMINSFIASFSATNTPRQQNTTFLKAVVPVPQILQTKPMSISQ